MFLTTSAMRFVFVLSIVKSLVLLWGVKTESGVYQLMFHGLGVSSGVWGNVGKRHGFSFEEMWIHLN